MKIATPSDESRLVPDTPNFTGSQPRRTISRLKTNDLEGLKYQATLQLASIEESALDRTHIVDSPMKKSQTLGTQRKFEDQRPQKLYAVVDEFLIPAPKNNHFNSTQKANDHFLTTATKN